MYREQHEKDKTELIGIIKEMLPEYHVDEGLLSEYVNNIDALQIVKMRPYYEEL